MSEKKKISEIDPENDLADQWNEKLKLDKSGNIALILVCIFEFLLLMLFSYLIEVFIFHDTFDLLQSLIIAIIITCVFGYLAYKRRKNKK